MGDLEIYKISHRKRTGKRIKYPYNLEYDFNFVIDSRRTFIPFSIFWFLRDLQPLSFYFTLVSHNLATEYKLWVVFFKKKATFKVTQSFSFYADVDDCSHHTNGEIYKTTGISEKPLFSEDLGKRHQVTHSDTSWV